MDWRSLSDWLEISNLLLTQVPPPDSSASEVELLKSQLEFLKWMNTAFLGLLGFLGALLTWFFNKNLEDAKRLARELVRQELVNHINPLIEAEAKNVVRTLRTEQVIGDTVVDYYSPSAETEPVEYQLLQGRGFLKVRFWNAVHQPTARLGSVLVIDFVNSEILQIPGLSDPDDEIRKAAYQEREAIVTEKIHDIVNLRLGKPILVIYVRPGSGRIESIDKLTTNIPEIKFYSSANTPVALMGAVVDSAYVAYGNLTIIRNVHI
jgi:hypothetical protein